MCTPIQQRITVILPGQETLLSAEALAFVAKLHEVAAGRRFELLAARATTPIDRVVLAEGLRVIDLGGDDDASWAEVMRAHLDLRDEVREIEHHGPSAGRGVVDGATHLVRPRELHVEETHLWLHRRPLVAGIVDAGLHLVTNAATLLARDIRPTLLLTDLRCEGEAQLWHDVLTRAERLLGLPQGVIGATTPDGDDGPAATTLERLRGAPPAARGAAEVVDARERVFV